MPRCRITIAYDGTDFTAGSGSMKSTKSLTSVGEVKPKPPSTRRLDGPAAHGAAHR